MVTLAEYIGVAYAAQRQKNENEAIRVLNEALAQTNSQRPVNGHRGVAIAMLAELVFERAHNQDRPLDYRLSDMEEALGLLKQLEFEKTGNLDYMNTAKVTGELVDMYFTLADESEVFSERIRYLQLAAEISPADQRHRTSLTELLHQRTEGLMPEVVTAEAAKKALADIETLEGLYSSADEEVKSSLGELKARVYFGRARNIMDPVLNAGEMRQEDLPTMVDSKKTIETGIQVLIDGGYQKSELFEDAVARARALGGTITELEKAWAKHPDRVFSISHDQDDRYLVNELC